MSHITVPAHKVLSAAEKIIVRILNGRAVRNERMISDQMRKKKFIIFGATYTREEAIQYLRDESFGPYPSMYAWGDLDRAKALRTLARNGDPVVIDADDAELLWG